MKYKRQPQKPDWFYSDDSKIYASATFGTHLSNEWYEFDDRQDALEMVNLFESQRFVDNFTYYNGEYYLSEDIIWDGDCIQNLVNLRPAEIDEMINAESAF
tara:strand:+ start:720 stop:1022 length:303 start_codon:yes stop_codon:yes gene_type:complete